MASELIVDVDQQRDAVSVDEAFRRLEAGEYSVQGRDGRWRSGPEHELYETECALAAAVVLLRAGHCVAALEHLDVLLRPAPIPSQDDLLRPNYKAPPVVRMRWRRSFVRPIARARERRPRGTSRAAPPARRARRSSASARASSDDPDPAEPDLTGVAVLRRAA